MANLAYLLRLDLSYNELTGEIPPALSTLQYLESLELYQNRLSGEIPPELGNLTSLQRLSLGDNQLSGPIPADLAKLSNLTSLSLGRNQLSGEIPPELGGISTLGTLRLTHNQLSGEIPSELSNLPRIRNLNISHNLLSGEIPPELGRISSLETLRLTHNQLSGEIPPELGNLPNIYGLAINDNQLSGEIPPELGKLRKVEWLNLARNQLVGTIPKEIIGLTRMYNLTLSGNQLSGPIPPEIGERTSMRYLVLDNNQFSGEIPPELGDLFALEDLHLQGNRLSGSIPSELGKLSRLERLYLYDNRLTGELSVELAHLRQLERLYVGGNRLSGCIPIPQGRVPASDLDNLGLEYCEDLEEDYSCSDGRAFSNPAANPGLLADCDALLASRDTLAGTGQLNWWADIPMTAWEGIKIEGMPRRVTEVVFQYQRLTGIIPPELGELTGLRRLSLRGNFLTGQIPPELGNLSHLEVLNLSDSQLTGEIPPELNQLSSLNELVLSENQLTGQIFPGIGNLKELEWLELHSNSLEGEIPGELGSIPNLEILELYGNLFTGCLPWPLTVKPGLEFVHDNLPGCPGPILVVQEGGEVSIETADLFMVSDIHLFAPGGVHLEDALNGTVLLDGMTIIFQHDGSETDRASFYYVAEKRYETTTIEILVEVIPVNDLPEAGVDRVSVVEGEFVLVPAPSLLTNDTDPDSENLTVIGVGQAKDGSVSLSDDVIVYEHDGSDRPVASFTYTLTDGVDFSTGLVLVNVTPVNDRPVAVGDNLEVDEGDALLIDPSILLENDVDPDGDSLTVTETGKGRNGVVVLKDGMISYTHDGSEIIEDSFTYTISDGEEQDTSTVTITVRPVNDPPVARDDAVEVDEGGTISLQASALLANDYDAEEDGLVISEVGDVINGTVSLDGTTITYTHDGSETGMGNFSYTVSDGTDVAEGAVRLSIRPVNDLPEAVADVARMDEGTTLSLEAASLLANDTDAEEDTLRLISVGEAINGMVFLDGTTIAYTHDGSETVMGSFSYTISDGYGSSTGGVLLNVKPVNDTPVAVDDSLEVVEGGTLSFESSTLLKNDSDVDGDVLTLMGVGRAEYGSVFLDGTTVTYTHDGSETTADSFSYLVSDSAVEVSAEVEIAVTLVNDPPIAVTDRVVVNEGESIHLEALTLLQNDSDPDSEILTITAVGDALNGTILLDGTTVVYEHDGSETLSGGFTYTVSDGIAIGTGRVEVDVTPVSDFQTILAITLAIAGVVATLTGFLFVRKRKSNIGR